MSFFDGLSSAAQINAPLSSNYLFDPRGLVCQSRSHGSTYASEDFASLADWDNPGLSIGTGYVHRLDLGDGGSANPAQNHCVELGSGATVGGQAWISDPQPHIPENYGVMMLVAITNACAAMGDGLQTMFESSYSNRVMLLEHNATGVYVQDAHSGWVWLTQHYSPIGAEWWIENKDNGDGTNTITLLGGTQIVNQVVVTLPVGSPANAGLVMFKQLSTTSANNTSRVYQYNIGDTQLPDDMILAFNAQSAPFNGSHVQCLFIVEDVCQGIRLGQDFVADVQINNGSFSPLTLTECSPSGWLGIIDYTKPVRFFIGKLAVSVLAGQNILPRCRLLNGRFGAVLGAGIVVQSIY